MTRRQFCRGLLGATLALAACGSGPGNGVPPRPRPPLVPTPPPPKPVPPAGDLTITEADVNAWRTFTTVQVRINGVIFRELGEIKYG